MVGHAVIGDREWLIQYNIGDIVYHIAEHDKKPGVVTQIILQDGRVVYLVEFGISNSAWFADVVLSREFKPDYVT